MSFTIDLDGRTALVTGGGQGVGRGIGQALAAAGAVVPVNDYVPERAEQVAKEISAAGGTAEARPFDVSDCAAVTAALGRGPDVGILVNNAGMAGPVDPEATTVSGQRVTVSSGAFADTDPADWSRYFAVNLFGVLNCTRAVLPAMVTAGEGRVITIVSDAGCIGEPNMAPSASPPTVASLVTFLASPLASWISGQTYPVNGGYSVTS